MSKKENAVEAAAAAPEVAAPKVTVKEAARQVMYIGPSRLKDGLRSKQVFKGMPEALIASLTEKYPSIKRLFADVEKLAAAMDQVKRKGTPVFLAYQEVLGVRE